MLPALAIALGGSVGLAAAHPHPQRREVASFPAGASWDIILNKGNTDLDGGAGFAGSAISAIDIDLFDNDASTISALKAQNTHVICYFSAGSREDWREDAAKFTANDYGQGLDGWAGENWVNVKSANVRNIMKSRIELAAQKGCTAVDPDNVDGFSGDQDGFGLDQSAYADYVKFLASTAAANNLAIGLKNALDLIPDVVDVIQFAVNEQCHEYNECGQYKPLTAANKAVFNIEYGGNACTSPAGVNLSILIKNEDQALDTLGGACKSSGGSTQASAAPAASKSAVAENHSVPAPAKTSSLSVAPIVKPTPTPAVAPSSSAVQPSSPAVVTSSPAVVPSSSATATAATPEPTAGAGDEDEEDDAEEDDEEDEEDEDEEDSQPRWHPHHKHD